jgi:uracil-DNA glycosylase family 4
MDDVDLEKAIRQHLELDALLTGFAVARGGREQPEADARDRPEAQVQASPLDQIAGQIEACRQCELGEGRARAVPGEGNLKARLMFVGEAPGTDEDRQGRPFVGAAGKFLDKIISACGLRREDVFIANVLKCHPPHDRDPRPEEIVACLPFLQRQVELIRPQVIVALGAHAARTLLNVNLSIGQLRGHFHPYPLSDGTTVKVMPTFHPAYLLRSMTRENRAKVWEDMKAVLTELGLPIPETSSGR